MLQYQAYIYILWKLYNATHQIDNTDPGTKCKYIHIDQWQYCINESLLLWIYENKSHKQKHKQMSLLELIDNNIGLSLAFISDLRKNCERLQIPTFQTFVLYTCSQNWTTN